MAFATGLLRLLKGAYGEEQMYFPDGNGKQHIIDLLQKVSESELFVDVTKIQFLLFTRANRFTAQELILNDGNSVSKSHFRNRRTMFIVHGWMSDRHSHINELIKESALNERDVNVIVVDWGQYASKTNYNAVVHMVPRIGKIVAQFIDFMNTRALSFSFIHLVGFSLGGHLVGVAARNCSRGKIPRITSLDPAGPGWGPDNMERISSNDATYVEIIHTNSGFLGNADLLGDVDFFVNGGSQQPGCLGDFPSSHSRAYEYYSETIGNKDFLGIRCKTTKEANSMITSGIHMYHMGGSWDTKNHGGIFSVRTNSKSPYAMK